MTNQEYLTDIGNECIEQLIEFGVPIGRITGFTINTRAQTRWGQCRLTPNGYAININADLCDGNHEDGLRNTIYHELVHSCKGCMNHGKEWKRWANLVYEKTGLLIKRANNASEKGFDNSYRMVKNARYNLICNNCGFVYAYQRKTKAIKYYDRCRCSICKGTLRLEVN